MKKRKKKSSENTGENIVKEARKPSHAPAADGAANAGSILSDDQAQIAAFDEVDEKAEPDKDVDALEVEETDEVSQANKADATSQVDDIDNADKPDEPDESPSPEEPSQEQEEESSASAHFGSIPAEKLARAKSVRRTLIVAIAVLLLILLGVGAVSAYYFFSSADGTAGIEQPNVVIESDGGETQDRGITESIGMPNLAKMMGRSPEEVVAILGSDYSISKVDTVAEENPEGTEEEPVDDPDADPESEASATAAKIATISYTPKQQTSSVGSTQVQNIYLTLDESDKTIEVYFVSSMNLLDFRILSFADLVATKATFVDTLIFAGLNVETSIGYTAPTVEEYTEYVDEEASIKKVKKETMTWEGSLISAQPPTSFEITFTYDFGASGAEDVPDKQPTQRMLYIKLV